MNNLEELRKKIDKIDKKVLELLAERFSVTQKVGEYKAKHNLKAKDKKREEEIAKRRGQLSKKLGLDNSLSEGIFRLIIKKVRENHKKISNEAKRKKH